MQHWASCCKAWVFGRAYQIVGVEVGVHADIRPPRGQVPHHPPWARPEVLEGVLSIDAALDGMPLHCIAHNKCMVLRWCLPPLSCQSNSLLSSPSPSVPSSESDKYQPSIYRHAQHASGSLFQSKYNLGIMWVYCFHNSIVSEARRIHAAYLQLILAQHTSKPLTMHSYCKSLFC